MADASGYLSSIITGAQGVGFSMIGIVAWVAVVILASAIAAVVTWVLLRKKKFNNKIIIQEKINNTWQITKRDVAAEVSHGRDGTTVFYLKKNKKTLPKPVIQIGPRTFLYKIREDGEWINIPLLGGEEETKEQLQKYMMHNDMRLSRSSLQKRMQDRYEKKPSWLAQNWTWIVGISFVMILAVSVFLLFDKWIELAQVTNNGVATAGEVIDKVNILMTRLETTCAGGTGYIKLPTA